MSNRLAEESSPYLRQHADNPVDWYPWGQEALERARREDKPIFLSIGYSACHWCHVMAHESFEDAETAALLNEGFVNIKVDREERPDLDRIYMSAVQAISGRGGWPMSVFLTPDGKPFFGGTYFPKRRRYGMPSFMEVLAAVLEAWHQRRDEVERSGEQLRDLLAQSQAPAAEEAPLTESVLAEATEALAGQYDAHYGGWGSAPKFPQPMIIEFLLRYAVRTGSTNARRMATDTLKAMARGGMYDQLGGGFHRYAVDEYWLIPHFEKMLYDNAQLARVYLHAWQLTGEPFFRIIAEETLDYVLREMADPAGGFYSSQDADSEGVEGKFYLWSAEEIRRLLAEEADRFMSAYGVSEEGNFEGRNILALVGSLEERDALAKARRKLFEERERRVHPRRDEKVLTSWNGLMLAALAEAGRVLHRDDYVRAAVRNADFIWSALSDDDGRLRRIWKDGQARLQGYLEDHTHVLEGLLALYQTTFEARWFVAARQLAEQIMVHFRDQDGFYDTADDHEELIMRPRELQDNAIPSGNSMAALAFIELAGLAQDEAYLRIAEKDIAAQVELLRSYPLGFANWLVALDLLLAERQEIAILGVDVPERAALVTAAREGYRPHALLAVGEPGMNQVVPLLRGKAWPDGKAIAYVCRNNTCMPPVTTPEELTALLS
ncbi:MAG: thioredoxin domain-containing protein [Chloroflexi bacterium]|nr:thioredoxin domain-containing protein [Chloroflexota bacterium]